MTCVAGEPNCGGISDAFFGLAPCWPCFFMAATVPEPEAKL